MWLPPNLAAVGPLPDLRPTMAPRVHVSTAPTVPTLTESDVLGLLRAKLTKPAGNASAEFALLPFVRNAAGFKANRTFDAVAVSLWQSRGFTIHIYEVKCSRSDWLRELKDPSKADAATAFGDYFSVVVSDRSIVRDGELPPTWGLLAVHGTKLRTITHAPLLPGADPTKPIPRSVLVPMLRSAGAALDVAPLELRMAREEGQRMARGHYEVEMHTLRDELARAKATLATIEDATGLKFRGYNSEERIVRAAVAIRAVLAGDGAEDKARQQLGAVRQQLANALDAINKAIG